MEKCATERKNQHTELGYLAKLTVNSKMSFKKNILKVHDNKAETTKRFS